VVNDIALPQSPAVERRGPSWHTQRAPLTRFTAVVLVLIAWEALARSGAVSPLFLSSPSQVVARLAQLFGSGLIWPHLRASGQEALIGFGLAIAVGVPIGVGMGRVEVVRHALEPLVAALYSSPAVAFLPLLIIWLGTGLWSKVFLVFVGAVVVLIVNTETGVANVDAHLVEMARAFTASRRHVLTKVVLPAAAPFILAGVRLAVGRVLIMVVVAELYASTAGVGYLIFQGGAMYDATLVFAGVTLMAAAGVVISQALRVLERRLAPWRQRPEN
jgi:ABC-type nitrate/sulfonate/bicarbonate transport system permease component